MERPVILRDELEDLRRSLGSQADAISPAAKPGA